MEDAIVTAVVFTGIYSVIKVFTDYLLKRKLIVGGHVEKAEILDAPRNKEENAYPTLKWGLVALFAGLGLLAINFIDKNAAMDWRNHENFELTLGIELVAISLGFLTYFMIMRFSSGNKTK